MTTLKDSLWTRVADLDIFRQRQLKDETEVIDKACNGTLYGLDSRFVGFVPAYFRDTQEVDRDEDRVLPEIAKLQDRFSRLSDFYLNRISIPQPVGLGLVRVSAANPDYKPAMIMKRIHNAIDVRGSDDLKRILHKGGMSSITYREVIGKVQDELDKFDDLGLPRPSLEKIKFMWCPMTNEIYIPGACSFGEKEYKFIRTDVF